MSDGQAEARQKVAFIAEFDPADRALRPLLEGLGIKCVATEDTPALPTKPDFAVGRRIVRALRTAQALGGGADASFAAANVAEYLRKPPVLSASNLVVRDALLLAFCDILVYRADGDATMQPELIQRLSLARVVGVGVLGIATGRNRRAVDATTLSLTDVVLSSVSQLSRTSICRLIETVAADGDVRREESKRRQQPKPVPPADATAGGQGSEQP